MMEPAKRANRQAQDTFGVMDELAMSAEHLFGTQGDLLDRPTVYIDGINAFEAEFKRGGKQPRVLERWVVKSIDINSRVGLIRHRLG